MIFDWFILSFIIIYNMENGGFSFKRKEHDRIILKSYEHLYKEKAFHDVTLISTDFIPMKAHKTVLFAGSNFFKTLFNIELNKASNSVLYLKGINSFDLNLILAFIYLGEVNVSEDRVDDFLNIASELQLEGFSSNGDMNIDVLDDEVEGKAITETDSDEKFVDISSNDNITLQSYPKLEKDSEEDKSHVSNEIESLKKRLKNVEPVPICQICNRSFKLKSSLDVHNKTVHLGLKLECQICRKKFVRLDVLNRHIRNIHDGQTYECQYCSYVGKQKYCLTLHLKNKHSNELL